MLMTLTVPGRTLCYTGTNAPPHPPHPPAQRISGQHPCRAVRCLPRHLPHPSQEPDLSNIGSSPFYPVPHHFWPLDIKELDTEIMRMAPNKALGPDKLPVLVLLVRHPPIPIPLAPCRGIRNPARYLRAHLGQEPSYSAGALYFTLTVPGPQVMSLPLSRGARCRCRSFSSAGHLLMCTLFTRSKYMHLFLYYGVPA